MVLLIIVAALLTDYFARWPQGLRDFDWYQHHVQLLSALFAPGAISRALANMPFALADPEPFTLANRITKSL